MINGGATMFGAYPAAAEELKNLFGREYTEGKMGRLAEIYASTDAYWWRAVEKIPDRIVRYLLIGEAPPWSEPGPVVYAYNRDAPATGFLAAMYSAFFDGRGHDTIATETMISRLESRGMLLVDSLPFAMNYSNPNRRGRKAYRRLVERALDEYFYPTLSRAALSWSPNLRVALAVTLNARAIVGCCRGRLDLPGFYEPVAISESQAAVNEAHYLAANAIRKVYELYPACISASVCSSKLLGIVPSTIAYIITIRPDMH